MADYKAITIYKTSDGREFSDADEAQAHVDRVSIRAFCNSRPLHVLASQAGPLTVPGDTVAEWVMLNWPGIRQILE